MPGRGPGPGTISELLDDIAAVLAEMELGLHTQTVLRGLAVQAHAAGENAFTFGRLHGVEDLRAAQLGGRLNALRKALKRARQP